MRKPEPDSLGPSRAQIDALIKERYPDIWTHKVLGTPVVTVLVTPDGRITRSDLEVFRGSPAQFVASDSQFARLGPVGAQIQRVGVRIVASSVNTLIEVFGITDSRELDRALVERFFPTLLEQGIPPGEEIWMLFDHEGRVLRAGEEHIERSNLRTMLESRFPGIRTASAATFPVFGRDGQPIKIGPSPLELHCVWLAIGSRLPK